MAGATLPSLTGAARGGALRGVTQVLASVPHSCSRFTDEARFTQPIRGGAEIPTWSRAAGPWTVSSALLRLRGWRLTCAQR